MGRPSKRVGSGRMGRPNKKFGSGEQPRPRRYLGEEIIEEILSRLPVKSLLRFQLVSKSWASLIGSERFIKTHLKNSRENADLGNHRIIHDYLPGYVSSRKGEISELQYSVHSLMNDPVPVSDPSGLEHPTDFRIVGCCNGLVCIRNPLQRSFYLWNPSTRICIELPKLETKVFINRTGFGWDESSGAYKVFVFLCVLTAAGMDRCVVYSSKTSKWEKVETNFDWGIFCAKEDGVLVNGKFHWHGYGGRVVVIVSLDLRSAVIGTLDQQPCDGSSDLLGQRLSLGVVGGCLSVAHHRRKIGEELDVWVMKEYGVKESWYRAMAVRLDHLIPPYYLPNSYIKKKKDRFCICMTADILGHCICMPLNATANVLGQGPEGEILISYESFFLAYHSKKEDAVVSRHMEIKDGARARAHLYFESLVSPERVILGQSRNTQRLETDQIEGLRT